MTETERIELAFHYSRFAQRVARRDAALAERVRAAPAMRPALDAWRQELAHADRDTLDATLRRMRRELLLRTLVRDLVCAAPLDELVGDLSSFADIALEAATAVHARVLFGSAEAPHGFSTVAMGKLGAGELNASSDIDIVFIADRVPPEASDALNRLARLITRSLGQEQDGEFVFRVDLRLRPYGDAGPMVPTLGFLEQYFVAHGRMWERLAWLKARVASGPLGADLAALTTPFVFRRYLDFDAVAAMRELHAQLRAEKNDPDNIKLGRGGIRELEFGTQLRQLVRAGRDPALRVRPTLAALAALAASGRIEEAQRATLETHYRFLRRLEHTLQYRDDQQTQLMPRDAAEREAIAHVLGMAGAAALDAAWERTRGEVAAYFDGTLSGAFGVSEDTAARIQAQPRATVLTHDASSLAAAGYRDAEGTAAYVGNLLDGARARTLPAVSRERLVRLAQATLAYAARTPEPDAAARRTLDLLLAVASRSAYLALMSERPQVLDRVIDLAAVSDWAVRYVMRHPLLLDELMDGRSLSTPIDYGAWRADLVARLNDAGGDTERAMDAIRHVLQNETFGLLLKDVAGLLPVETLSDHLSALADVIVDATLEHLLAAAALPPAARLAVIAYGRWGGKELAYGSDLDLIFLMPDAAAEHRDALTRLAQRLQSWLTTMTAAGRAYEIDARLRPDGAAGLLLSTVSAFADYQRDKAWTWEHQALTRARFAAGDAATGAAFERIREEIIARPRDWPKLRDEVIAMRARVAEGHPNRRAGERFDLKHDTGGLVDMEFAVQALVLRHAATQRTMRADHGNIALAIRAGELGLVQPAGLGRAAADAYRTLRARQHAFRLHGNEHAIVPGTELAAERAAIRAFYDAALAA